MKIKEVTERYGISRKALLIYEEKGLIQPIRNASGYREYDRDSVEMIGKIAFLRKLEFSLDEIETILIHHNYEIFESKKEEYDTNIHFIETKKSYLDYANDVFKGEYPIDEAIEAIDDTIQLYKDQEYNEMIHFEFHRDTIMMMWLITLIISFLSGQFYLIIAAFCSLLIPIIFSLKSVRNFFLSRHARIFIGTILLILGCSGIILLIHKSDNILTECLFGVSIMLCFSGIATFRQVQKLFKKYQVIISTIFFIIGLMMYGSIFLIEFNGKLAFGYILIATFLVLIGIIFNRFIRKILGYIFVEII